MIRRELDAAGIHHPTLRAGYVRCRHLHAAHGRTYYLATCLLPPARRPAIHALYGFARWVDDIIDETPDPTNTTLPNPTPIDTAPSDTAPSSTESSSTASSSTGPPSAPSSVTSATERLDEIDRALRTALEHGPRPGSPVTDRASQLQPHDELVLTALIDTVSRYGIPHRHLTDFLAAMRMDLTVTDYATREALDTYVHGSAEVIGFQVLPVLGTSVPERAAPHAAALGNAFQATNFLRDVGEDLDRGRVYLPAEELAPFGVDRERLLSCRRRGKPDPPVRRALSDQVARIQALYRRADPGIAMLDSVSRPCVATARTLYGEILDRIVESGYDVFRHRLAVPNSRRVGVAVPAIGSALAARAATAVRAHERRG